MLNETAYSDRYLGWLKASKTTCVCVCVFRYRGPTEE